MSKVWLFGGSKKPFGKKLTADLDVELFGRHNIDYTNPEKFIKEVVTVPDTVIFF